METISYPPIIDGALGAFYDNFISIPFTMNRAVAQTNVMTFKLRIKNISSNTLVFETTQANWNKDKSIVTFTFTNQEKNALQVPNHYKIQIAYVSKDVGNTVSPYSTVGIAKYTTKPSVIVEAVDANPRNILGTYSTEDSSEKLYSSYFTITDTSNNIFFQSQEKIHNAFDDSNSKTAIEKLNLIKSLELGKNYYVQFHIKTINEIELSSTPISIRAQSELPTETSFNLKADLSFDNGYINLYLTSNAHSLSKTYKLARADSRDNYETWTEILDFEFSNTSFPIQLWRDFTIEQGVTYEYALYEYNNRGFYGSKIKSRKVFADFEDIFLYDGQKQLKIRFNPKISNLKNTLLESKQDTIGGQYPFIFRNGNVNYKEFQLSGLISYLEDEADLFLTKDKDFENATNLTGENIYKERVFKMKVLEWLTNGEPKIFKSPAEGNYIVRLMNVSLTPLSDGINRMLHSFSSSAYEIDGYNIEALLKHDFINTEFKLPEQQLSFMTFSIKSLLSESNIIEKIDGKKAYSLKFYIQPNAAQLSEKRSIIINGKYVWVYDGYSLPNTEITELRIDSTENYTEYDSVVIGYYPNLNPVQPTDISTIKTVDIPCYQAFGQGTTNLLSPFIAVNKNLEYVYEFKVSAGPISYIYEINDKYYNDMAGLKETNIIPNLIYKIMLVSGEKVELKGYYYLPYKGGSFIAFSATNPTAFPTLTCQYYNRSGISFNINIPSTSFSTIIDDVPTSIYASPGVIVEIGGCLGQYDYEISEMDQEISDLNTEYDKAIQDFENHTPSADEEQREVIISQPAYDSAGNTIGTVETTVKKSFTEILVDRIIDTGKQIENFFRNLFS